jgi:hypothetical protein
MTKDNIDELYEKIFSTEFTVPYKVDLPVPSILGKKNILLLKDLTILFDE